MKKNPDLHPAHDRAAAAHKRDRTLVRSFAFLGGILGLGLFGLGKSVVLFLATLGWIRSGVDLGAFYLWCLGGVGGGLVLGWGLVRARRME